MRKIKLIIAVAFIAGMGFAIAGEALGYPAFLPKARKFGAKDCTFCHVNIEGGEPWNQRGQWLVAEKERRKADVVDPAWLADYKPGKTDEQAKGPQAPEAKEAAAPAKIDPKLFDDYVGEYELPTFRLVITREGDRLFGQPPGDTKEELVPESETEFTVPAIGAKVKFMRDDKGKVTHVALERNGQKVEGKKIK